MLVSELIDLFVDENLQKVTIYDLNEKSAGNETLYSGPAGHLPYKYEQWDICSIDHVERDGVIVINVDSGEEPEED